ncbi:MAG: hypothetical protein JO328_20885 [Hyphomicrobiales bacterium]|nr:hypothetical protein [Hyphomicrobiales bacterium]MBV8826048.1 hypothetical protein [Hyphomicrobiales bacterium]
MRARGKALALGSAVAVATLFAGIPAYADNGNNFYEIETKYIFGFTEGSGIGLEGEKEFSPETVINFGKRDGRYAVSETKFEYEFTPNQYIQIELGPLVSYYDIRNVTGLDDMNAVKWNGFFAELRYLLFDRGTNQPLAVTLSAEPEWHAFDETSGAHVVNYGLEMKVNADLELMANRLYLGANTLYEPETTRADLGGWDQESTLGQSLALAYRVRPDVTIGAEAWYLRHYDGIFFNSFTGDAVYVGPTLYVQLSNKAFMTAAWNTQIAGHEAGVGTLDLADFSRHRAKVKFAFEF